RKARSILENVKKVMAIELLCACQALDFRSGASFENGSISYKLKSSPAVNAAHASVRKRISHLDDDRELHLDINEATRIIESGELISVVESEI
ncbi:aromatic amino acid lyase, partial [Acinetobacter baumannii]